MVSLPNIYKSKHLRYFPVIPIALMLLSLYLAGHVTLDSSLRGGVSIILQTNSSMSSQQLAAAISSKLHVPDPSIQKSAGGLQITLAFNQSLAEANIYQIGFDQNNSAYKVALTNKTIAEIALSGNQLNQSLVARISNYSDAVNRSMAGMRTQIEGERNALAAFIGTPPYDPNSASNMSAMAAGMYEQASNVYENRTVSALQGIIPFSTFSYSPVSATVGRYFLGELEGVIITAFILISIVVFFIFRSPVPAFTVVFGAANDILIALGGMAIFGIPLGVVSIGGLLMLIGYAIDTDVLSAIRILKRHEGTPEDRAYASMKTGMTMTTTAIVSFAVLFVVALLTYVPTYYEIAGVVLIGLVGDLLTTWLGNTPLVLMYKKRKERI